MTPIMERTHAKRQARRRETGEDFTPEELVNQMLDQLSGTFMFWKAFVDEQGNELQ